MKIELELPEVSEDRKSEIRDDIDFCSPINMAASVGNRFNRLLKLIELNAPKAIVDNGKKLLAEALYRHHYFVYETNRGDFYEGCEPDEEDQRIANEYEQWYPGSENK